MLTKGEVMYIQDLLRLNKEILGWLSVQKGMIPRDYAKDLARLLVRVEDEVKTKKEGENGLHLHK